jgi:hypothetical protein
MAERIPGIIVRVVNDTGIIAAPVFQRYPVYIGEGDPYRLVTDYKITRGSGSSDHIPTITSVQDIVSIGDLPGIAKYVSATDYNLSAGHVSWVPAGDSPTPGDNYYITFTETRPASAFNPMLYFNENLIYSDHGNGLRTNGAINDVSVAGALGLNAGARGVIVAQLDLSAAVDPDSPTNAELETAFIAMRDKLEKITDYKLFLVPMSSGTLNTTSAANIFFNHAVLCSQPENKQERTCIAALPLGTAYTGAATFAQSYAHERMVVPYTFDATCTVTGYSGSQDTRFYNAALAGKLCSVGIGRTIHDEIIPNVSMGDNLTPGELQFLVQRGVSATKVAGEVLHNVMANTTDTTNALTEDLGVQDVKDYVKKYWREGLWAAFRNAPITTTLPSEIEMASRGILDRLLGQSIVAEYKNISAAQDNAEPRKIIITGKIKPAYGLAWMDVTFTFVLSFT